MNRGKLAYQEQKKKNLLKLDDEEFDKIYRENKTKTNEIINFIREPKTREEVVEV